MNIAVDRTPGDSRLIRITGGYPSESAHEGLDFGLTTMAGSDR